MDALNVGLNMLSSVVGLFGFTFLFIALNRFWDKRDTITDTELLSVKKDLKIAIVTLLIFFSMLFLSFVFIV